MNKLLELFEKLCQLLLDDVKFRISIRILTNYWRRSTNVDFWRS